MYFLVHGNPAPLLALGADLRPLVALCVDSNGTSVQRPSKSPARCVGLEPTTQTTVGPGVFDNTAARFARQPPIRPVKS